MLDFAKSFIFYCWKIVENFYYIKLFYFKQRCKLSKKMYNVWMSIFFVFKPFLNY